MYLTGRNKAKRAFALPTVLIASVVLLSILAVSVTATTAVRTTLKNQYYAQLAQIAGESGVAYAKACLAENGNVPLWTDAKPLTPATDCKGDLAVPSSGTAAVLVVAGGGGGAGNCPTCGGAGGGGAGGLLYNATYPLAVGSVAVTVGNGGAGGAGANSAAGHGANGANSVFDSMTAIGGGGGRPQTGAAGAAGGSGGGGSGGSSPAAGAGGAGTAGQGNAGTGGGGSRGGGGGGAGGPAGANSAGGVGAAYTISGASIMYAGGGGGGVMGPSDAGGIGGAGGGGNGVNASVNNGNGYPGDANTGGGGGGANGSTRGGSGGAGGSGVVTISYPIASGVSATGGTITTAGSNRVHQFTTSGTFTVAPADVANCPNDPRCSVTVNGNVRSSFSVPRPNLDPVTGQAVTIPNSGYVEVTRTTTGAVWRTYRQPSVQAAVVPDLCSGNATAARGWSAAVRVASQDPLPSASAAQTISLADTALNAGPVYFRKDFNVSVAGTYDLNVFTSSSQDVATVYIDGVPVSTTAGSLATSQTTLTAGCHVVAVKLVNQTYLPRAADFTASITRGGAATPLVVTDASWRVTAGDAAHFSTTNYFEAPGAWEQVQVFGIWNNSALPWSATPSNWATVSGDSLTDWITTKANTGGTNRPGDSYSWFRNPTPFTIASETNVRVSTHCDDRCDLYLDGQLIMTSNYSGGLSFKNITIQPGTHTFGIRLYNAPTGNVAGILFSAVNTTTNQVIDRSSPNWNSTTSWSTTAGDPYSFDATYEPVPAIQKAANARVVVVGGGGGGGSDMGGGGGGGAVVSNGAFPLTAGSYTVTVGAGGAGGPAGTAQVRGQNGANSVFGTIRAIGGGGGGSAYAVNTSPPGSGASAGGSAGANAVLRASGVIGLGFDSVPTLGSYYPTGGGGAGGPGAVNPATGGIGVPIDTFGTTYYFGGGGGGSGYTGIGGNGGNGGGGGGAVGSTTGGAGINPGSPGGGGTTGAQTNRPGGAGGANTGGGGGGGSHYNSNNAGGVGGSGIVGIAIPTGSMSVTAPGANVIGAIPGYTIYTYTNVGTFTFTVNSVN